MSLSDYNDMELLAELVRRNGAQPAPTKVVRTTDHSQVVVGIGRDHVADIVVHDVAMDVLTRPLRYVK